uniref:Uncharacterized protein n=1 Tax=Anguilla anguilla TaxID=7936 RepID=A0A0E9QDB1_ANGAN
MSCEKRTRAAFNAEIIYEKSEFQQSPTCARRACSGCLWGTITKLFMTCLRDVASHFE